MMISEMYQILYTLNGRKWFIYKIVDYDGLHKAIDFVLRIDGVEDIKIEIMPVTDKED